MREVFQIKCRFEGAILGTIEKGPNWDIQNPGKDFQNPDTHDLADTRCNSCNVMHGRFKDMEKSFKRSGGTHEQFIAHMKKNEYKNTNLKKAIKNLQEGKEPDAPRNDE